MDNRNAPKDLDATRILDRADEADGEGGAEGARDEGTAHAEARIPRDGEYLGRNIWFARKGDVLTIGLTSHALEALGELEEIELPEEGDEFGRGETLVTIEGNQDELEVTAPSAATIVAVNPLASDVAAVEEDPLEAGWLVRIQIATLEDLLELD